PRGTPEAPGRGDEEVSGAQGDGGGGARGRGDGAPGAAGASPRLFRRCGGGEAAAAAEELETEGERQLKRLLRHQLDTAASLEQCVAKRHRFAPAAVYRPFGEEAAGARTLPEFRALQESSGEAASLQELGLSDAEIRLWRQRAQKGPGLGAAPEATRDRIRAIQEKIAERQRILSLPQHFAGSKSLSRREMEIENALFQGADRHPFLRMLYRPDEAQ
uniref:RNA binding motif protein 41 n=1 Tax=Pseudonaja textilis TaxID=8673 RepID=A0A670YYH7_PSETE